MAARCRAGEQTVRTAIKGEELEVEYEIVGPSGKVVTLAITDKAVRAWERDREKKKRQT